MAGNFLLQSGAARGCKLHKLNRLIFAVENQKLKTDFGCYHARFNKAEDGIIVIDYRKCVFFNDFNGDAELGRQVLHAFHGIVNGFYSSKVNAHIARNR